MGLTDFLPPQSLEAEMAALGSALMSRNAALLLVEKLGAEDFYVEAHRKLFAAMQTLRKQDRPIDTLTLPEELRRRDWLEAVGGLAYVLQIAESAPTAAHIKQYVEIVREKSRLRSGITLSDEYRAHCLQAELGADELDDWLIREVLKRRGKLDEDPVTRRELLQREKERAREQRRAEILRCPLDALQELAGGLEGGDLCLIGGRPGMGKSALLLQWADYCIREFGPAAYISLEMGGDQLARRSIASRSGMTYREIRDLAKQGAYGWEPFNEGDIQEFEGWVDEVADTPYDLWVDEVCGNLDRLVSSAYRWVAQYGIKALFVDYVQIIHAAGTRSRVEEVTLVGRTLKQVASRLRIPVIVASAANREVEKRGGDQRKKGEPEKPALLRMSDLLWSSELEFAANMVLLLNRHPKYPPPAPEFRIQETEVPVLLDVNKSRNGNSDLLALTFNKPMFKFEEHRPPPPSDEDDPQRNRYGS